MPNRLMLAPLTNCQSHADGTMSVTCASHVAADGQGFPGQLGIFGDQHLPGITRLAADLNASGTVSYAQLHHAGMRSPAELIRQQPVCPSDDARIGARALTTGEVEQATVDFVAAARRAQIAGFRGVEIHGAHGYLVCQFLSPEINRRTDRYGGSLEHRSRFLFDIVAGIRAECGPDMAIAVRVSSDRFGIVTEEMVEVLEGLVGTGEVDLVDMSLWDVRRTAADGTLEGQSLLDVFACIDRGQVRLGVAGQVHDPADVQEVLDRGVDVAVLGRVGILHHDYPHRLAADPGFRPRRLPAEPGLLTAEGVSPAFLDYLSPRFAGFVAA